MTRERQVLLLSKTANLGRKTLEVSKQQLEPRPRKGALVRCCSIRPLAGVERAALVGAPFVFGDQINAAADHDSLATDFNLRKRQHERVVLER